MSKYGKFFKFIKLYEKIIITSHENPDPDALGSEYALCCLLLDMGYDASIYTCEEIPVKYSFINERKLINIVSRQNKNIADSIAGNAAIIVVDTNTFTNTGYIYKLLGEKIRDIFIIDHHEIDKSIYDKEKCIIEENSSSTCQIVYNIAKSVGYNFKHDFAQAVYSGILYDTGSFIYPKTDYRTFRTAAELVKSGVIPNRIYSSMYESNTLSSLKLQSKIFSDIRFFHNNKIALQILRKDDLLEFGAKYEEGETIINLPMKCRDILVSVLFKENMDGVTRCSIRSKFDIDISKIAMNFGGGGHTTAAGFKCNESLEIVQEKVIKELGTLVSNIK